MLIPSAAVVNSGKAVYAAQCAACHAAGAAGSPKFGDTAQWKARTAKGYNTLLASTLKGLGAMPAQSGGRYSDHEIGLAVVHMINAAGGELAAPKQDPIDTTKLAVDYDLAAGKRLYSTICNACHVAGIAGAPKFGEKAAWAGREEKGVAALAATVITGKGAMPARGGSDGTDEQIAAAVAYMLSELR